MQDDPFADRAAASGESANASSMVSSDDVNGTEVYSPTGDHLGEGEHSVPWKKLSCDVNLGGFVTDITQGQLTGAPSWTETWFDDPDYRKRNYDYDGVQPYWI